MVACFILGTALLIPVESVRGVALPAAELHERKQAAPQVAADGDDRQPAQPAELRRRAVVLRLHDTGDAGTADAGPVGVQHGSESPCANPHPLPFARNRGRIFLWPDGPA